MRIALTCPYHWFRNGGVQENILALEQEYLRRGHYARVITPLPKDYEGPVPETIITLGTSRNTTAFGGTQWQWSVSVDTDAIDEVFAREKFDVIHFHEPWIPVWGRQLVMRSKSANVATMHGRFYDTMKAKTVATVVTPYTKPMLKYFDAFTAVAEISTEYFRTLSKKPVTIIPNGINIAKYSTPPSKLQLKPQQIFYFGRLEHRKGVQYLLRAFAELVKIHPDTSLLITGSGPDDVKLRQLVHELQIPNVNFDTRYIPEEDKIRHLHESGLACFPSPYGESFGIVLLEAMSAGIPFVAGDNPGYAGVMKERGQLSLVNPKDTIDFARRLEIMLFDQDVRKIWQAWAKEYVKRFDWPIVADQYLEIYEQAIDHHARRVKT